MRIMYRKYYDYESMDIEYLLNNMRERGYLLHNVFMSLFFFKQGEEQNKYYVKRTIQEKENHTSYQYIAKNANFKIYSEKELLSIANNSQSIKKDIVQTLKLEAMYFIITFFFWIHQVCFSQTDKLGLKYISLNPYLLANSIIVFAVVCFLVQLYNIFRTHFLSGMRLVSTQILYKIMDIIYFTLTFCALFLTVYIFINASWFYKLWIILMAIFIKMWYRLFEKHQLIRDNGYVFSALRLAAFILFLIPWICIRIIKITQNKAGEILLPYLEMNYELLICNCLLCFFVEYVNLFCIKRKFHCIACSCCCSWVYSCCHVCSFIIEV